MIDPNTIIRKFVSDKKFKFKAKKKYNKADPIQRKRWWIDRVCYFCYIEKNKEVANALRLELNKPYVNPSIRKIANELWARRKEFDKLIERKLDESINKREDVRQIVRSRRQ